VREGDAMKISKIIKLAKVTIFTTFIVAPAANAAVVFVDEFDQAEVSYINTADSSPTWLRSRSSGFYNTAVTTGNGLLTVTTSDSPYGGAITKVNPDLDFFANELTITYRGISLQAIVPEDGNVNLNNQGVVIAVGSHLLGRNDNSWDSYAYFSARYFGSGYFEFSGHSLVTPNPVALQEIPTPYLNYSLSALTAVKLTLDDVNYRLLFEFGNPLNSLSFAGPHHLRKDMWNTSSGMRRLAKAKIAMEYMLDSAIAANDLDAIDAAQLALDAVLLDYNAQYAEEEATAGLFKVFFGAVSADRKGAIATLDSITVEETSDLQVLRP